MADPLAPPPLRPNDAAWIAQAIAVTIRDSLRIGRDYPPGLDAHRAWFAGIALQGDRRRQEATTGRQTLPDRPASPDNDPTLLTYEQAGHLMGVSARTVQRIPEDDLPRRRISTRTVRIHRDDIRDYLDTQTSEDPT